MGQDLITKPVSTALQTATDSDLVQRLRSSFRLDIRVRWDKDDDGNPVMIVVVAPTQQSDLNGASAFVNATMSPAAGDALTEALAVLAAVCLRPTDYDDAKIVLWTRRMLSALMDYPADIAMETLDEWPKSERGKFWPLENDVHVACGAKVEFRRRLARELELAARAGAAPMPNNAGAVPRGATQTFIEGVRSKQGDGYAAAWLSVRTCAFTDTEILTTSLGVERLERDVGEIAIRCGVTIKHEPQVAARFAAQS